MYTTIAASFPPHTSCCATGVVGMYSRSVSGGALSLLDRRQKLTCINFSLTYRFFMQMCCFDNLFEAGYGVNSSGDSWGQTPAHLAACGGQAFCLLWLLQRGADANHQDSTGETPFHKAARVGSLECLSALVACDAQLEICNNDGKTAEDLAWHYGFTECGRFLSTLRLTRHRKGCVTVPEERAFEAQRDTLSCTTIGQKRSLVSPDAQDGKKSRDW
ncbi:hypothetical protein ACEWY4_007287 [Coilia grayii]|uniref:Ankyrin repeat domain 37 n=1 Tax=Coilia grayii TaxID=363190 RepID=A0ABD1KFU6_9TELE